MVFRKKKQLFLTILIIAILIFVLLNLKYIFIFNLKHENKIGIIDDQLFQTYEFVTNLSEDVVYIANDNTHGDLMMQFLEICRFNGKVYYYSAIDSNGNINTDSIIKGLEVLEKQGIECVNLSLSSKLYSFELETWINDHPQIQIYASYNNLLNSFDYPAMYDKVIASGRDNKINYKEIDVKYSSNKLIVLNGLKFSTFEGNSYLSLLTMLNNQ